MRLRRWIATAPLALRDDFIAVIANETSRSREGKARGGKQSTLPQAANIKQSRAAGAPYKQMIKKLLDLLDRKGLEGVL